MNTKINVSDTIIELNKIYDMLNEKYFDHKLKPAIITIMCGKQRTKSYYGKFEQKVWYKKEDISEDEDGNVELKDIDVGQDEIVMSAEYLTRPFNSVCCTLLHEMIHQWCAQNGIEETSNNGTYHNAKFKHECEMRELIVEKEKIIGWAITTPSKAFDEYVYDVIEPVVDTTVFDLFRNTTFAPPKKAIKKRFMCPMCGLTVQAKKGSNIFCGKCGVRLDYWDMTDEDDWENLEDYNDGLWLNEDGFYKNTFGNEN